MRANRGNVKSSIVPAQPSGLLLSYAPPVRTRRRKFLVIPFGLLTTAAALFGVFLLAHRQQTNIMGWHYLYVIPYGAMIVGAVAGIGYAISRVVCRLSRSPERFLAHRPVADAGVLFQLLCRSF